MLLFGLPGVAESRFGWLSCILFFLFFGSTNCNYCIIPIGFAKHAIFFGRYDAIAALLDCSLKPQCHKIHRECYGGPQLSRQITKHTANYKAPRQITKTPRQITKTPRQITKTHGKLQNSTANYKNSRQIAKLHGKLQSSTANYQNSTANYKNPTANYKNSTANCKTPRQITKTPRQITKTPRQITKTPQQITKTPRQITKTPRQITKTPQLPYLRKQTLHSPPCCPNCKDQLGVWERNVL